LPAPLYAQDRKLASFVQRSLPQATTNLMSVHVFLIL
jgi:hypothetical protein